MKTLIYKACLFIIFIVCSLNAMAQSDSLQIDSLKKVLLTEKEDSNRVKTLNELSRQFNIDYDTANATNFAKKSLLLAEKTKFKKGIPRAYVNLAWACETKANLDDALNYYTKSLFYYNSLNDDSSIALVLVNMGFMYANKGNSDSALNYFNKSLFYYKQLNDDAGIAGVLLDIGYIYHYKANDSLSGIYLNDALKLFEKIGNKESIADFYWDVAGINYATNYPLAIFNYYKALALFEESGNKKRAGDCLEKIAFSYYYLENYNQSLDTYLRAIKIHKETNSFSGLASCYAYISNIYRIQKKYTEALKYDSIGLKISLKTGNKQPAANAYSGLGDLLVEQIKPITSSGYNTEQIVSLKEALKNYFESLNNYRDVLDSGGMGDSYIRVSDINIRLHHFSEAQKYVDSALFCAKAVRFPGNFKEGYQVQTKLDSAQGNYKQAYEHYKLYILFRDSIINEKATKKTLQTQMQYDFDKKEAIAKAAQDKKDADAKRLKNQQYFAIAALGIVILAVVIIALIQFRNNRHKQKANLLLERQKQKVESTLTELKSTQAQLIQSEKMASLGELTAGIAHEIQNPLNFVNNFSEVNKELVDELEQEADKGNIDEVKAIAKDIRDNEEKINHHGKRADAIVKGMLQHSRQTKGIKEPTDISDLCDEYLRLSYHGLRAKDKSFNADFTTDFDDSISKINIVPQDIGRVLLNLFNNAFYAVNEKLKAHGSQLVADYKPLVSIQTKKINDKIEITVTDNGNGIPQNIIDKIFQPFFTTKPTGQGTGLGLSLVYDIITKEHSGTIKVESKEGEGTEFIIQLPL